MRPSLLATIAMTIALSLTVAITAVADDGPVEIADAPALEWGFKQSWRIYAPKPAVAGGSTVVDDAGDAPYQLGWAFESGSYDAATGTTVLRYQGTAHWQKYLASEASIPPPAGYTGPMDIHILDVTMSDPIVTISADEATISVEARSRQLHSWEIEDLGRVPVVSLDVSGVTPAVADGTTTWAGIPAASSGSSNEVFAGNYPTGRSVDTVGFSYSGPGGAPDLSENWDAPGSAKLDLTQNKIVTEQGPTVQYSPYLLDRQNRIVHYRSFANIDGVVTWTYRALSLDTLTEVGEPLELPHGERIVNLTLFDPGSGRLFYRRSGEQETKRWIRYDAEQGKYVLGALDTALPIVGNQNGLIWDPVGDRAFNLVRHVPDGVAADAYDQHVWQLNSYREQENSTWMRESYDLPSFPAGLNATGYTTGSDVNAPSAVAAPDGSLIWLGDTQVSLEDGVSAPATVPGAYRISFDAGGGSVSVAPIAGTEVDNDFSDLFATLQAGPDGQVTLMRPANGSAPVVQSVTVTDGVASAAPAVALTGLDTLHNTAFAVDPEDGTAWVGGWQAQRLVGVRDGRIVADQPFPERHPRGGPLLAGIDHTVYAQTNDGSPATFGGSPIYGFGRFERLGLSPTLTEQPHSAAVELGVGEQAEAVEFASAASAEPAPQRQWQAKALGTSRFKDLDGETGPTLTVAAERGMGGTQYRAVYSNAAGRIASDVATLDIAYAPRITVDVASRAVKEGNDAVFQVLPEGDPDPVVTWQRRVGGFWQDIAPGDDNFAIDGGTLTVVDTNAEQSGSLFRARLSNSVATAYSKTGRLTVEPKFAIPAEGLTLAGVTLAWTGSAELQKAPPLGGSNYFSAGPSDGTQLTYASSADNVAIRQVTAGGSEMEASWPTRAAHVSGGHQLVRLSGGHAELAADGSADVRWTGSFSVNFYGGLVPFTIRDPELAVAGDGTGTLKADLAGYASSQQNPGERTPIDPVTDVTIATFSNVEVDPAGAVTVTPDYAGVEVALPPGATAQHRAGANWGAWPQPMVDFQLQTGLASYWYSSGGAADPYKTPDPFVVDFSGVEHPIEPPAPLPADVPIADAESTTALVLDRARRPYGARTTATVRVRSGASPAAGAVKVEVAGATVAGTLAGGLAKVALPRTIAPGRHRVEASYAGTAGVEPSSAAATLTVVKARPRLRLRLAKARIGTSRRAVVRIAATVPGGAGVYPTGQLVVRDDARVVRAGRLRRGDRGRAKIVLPKLARGVHYLRASLSGGALQHAAKTGYRSLRVD